MVYGAVRQTRKPRTHVKSKLKIRSDIDHAAVSRTKLLPRMSWASPGTTATMALCLKLKRRRRVAIIVVTSHCEYCTWKAPHCTESRQ